MQREPSPRPAYAPPPGARRWRLTAQWDGGGFVGWQSQPGQRSVQDTLQAALTALVPEVVAARPVAAGRTDVGVHAEAMPLHWDLPESLPLPPARLARALNARLPADLAVLEAAPAPPGFHARFSCRERHYVYRLSVGGERRPLLGGRALHLPARLDAAAMRAAAAGLIGQHDFAAFATQEERQTVRTLTRLDMLERGALTELHVSGESFLRHMVRGLVGTLLQVGRGELGADEVAAVLASRDRGRAGPNVPPHGLYFVGADYPGDDQAGVVPFPALLPTFLAEQGEKPEGRESRES